MSVRVGTQSWNFRAWVGPFYPPETAPRDMLGWYARMFGTLEVDSTFYAIPAEPIVRAWCEQVSSGFTFALKVPQEITHGRRLVGAEPVMRRFVDRVRCLGDALGPLLIQLPPDFIPTPETRTVLRDFIGGLPGGVRWAVEFRHPGWLDDPTFDLLRGANVALALVDGRWLRRATVLDLVSSPTADFGYIRWMGPERVFTDYSHPQTDRQAEREAWAAALKEMTLRVETVFGYFNNQYEGHSPHSAREMQRLLGETPVDPVAVRPQQELFQSP